MFSRGVVSAVDMYALAKHSPLFSSTSLQPAVFPRALEQAAPNSSFRHSERSLRSEELLPDFHSPGWLWSPIGLLLPPLPSQLSEFTSVLAARAHGQENMGVGHRAGISGTKIQLRIHLLRPAIRSSPVRPVFAAETFLPGTVRSPRYLQQIFQGFIQQPNESM